MSEESRSTGTELAHRSGDDLDVTLIWQRCDQVDSTVVCVCDWREGAYFEIPVEPHLALEVYHHPFVYRDFSSIDYANSRLAAQMIEIGRFSTRSDAEFARSALGAAGIPSVLMDEEPGGDYPMDLGGARLLVAEADADDAAMILSHLAANEDEQP